MSHVHHGGGGEAPGGEGRGASQTSIRAGGQCVLAANQLPGPPATPPTWPVAALHHGHYTLLLLTLHQGKPLHHLLAGLTTYPST